MALNRVADPGQNEFVAATSSTTTLDTISDLMARVTDLTEQLETKSTKNRKLKHALRKRIKENKSLKASRVEAAAQGAVSSIATPTGQTELLRTNRRLEREAEQSAALKAENAQLTSRLNMMNFIIHNLRELTERAIAAGAANESPIPEHVFSANFVTLLSLRAFESLPHPELNGKALCSDLCDQVVTQVMMSGFNPGNKLSTIIPPSDTEGGLYVGAELQAADLELLRKNNLSVVINVPGCFQESIEVHPEAISCDFHKQEDGIEYIHGDIPDAKDAVLPLDKLIADIDRARQERKNVLIHCKEGKSRTAAIAIGYLMRTLGMSYQDATNYFYDYGRRYIPVGNDFRLERANAHFAQQLRDFT